MIRVEKMANIKNTPVKGKKPKPSETKVPLVFYEARVGCWNCDEKYTISVLKGHITPQYIVDADIHCRGCGCDTLKMLSEYNIEKKIMKDVILHHRIEQLHEEQPHEPRKDHIHIG